MESYADNIKPTLIDNVFSDEEYDLIYSYINAMPEDYKNGIKDTGYIAFYDPTDDDISQTIINHAEKILGIKLKKYMTHFARYTLASESSPQLLPHYDTALNQASVTLSIILDSTFDWPVVVEYEKILATKNQAILFSGSHQVHWRPSAVFGPEDYYDIMVCQMVEDSDTPVILSKEHRDNMSGKIGQYVVNYYQDYPKLPYDNRDWLKEKLDLGWDGKDFCDELAIPIQVVLHFLGEYNLMEEFEQNAKKQEEKEKND